MYKRFEMHTLRDTWFNDIKTKTEIRKKLFCVHLMLPPKISVFKASFI